MSKGKAPRWKVWTFYVGLGVVVLWVLFMRDYPVLGGLLFLVLLVGMLGVYFVNDMIQMAREERQQ